MQAARVVKGRLTGPRTVELSEAVSEATEEVEVLIRPVAVTAQQPTLSVSEFLKRLPPGTRSREDIDQQIREERDSWGDR